MMYQNNLAVAIKHAGKILRENKDLVSLPYGSEFTVFVKNLNNRRVKFSLQIDGTDILGGEYIVIDANSETEIKRFLRAGNMNEGNAFKFIERTAAIEDGPRGIKIEDGIVRVEFWFEKEKPVYDTYPYNHEYWRGKQDGINDERNRKINPWFYGQNILIGGIQGSPGLMGSSYSANSVSASITNSPLRSTLSSGKVKGASVESIINDVGITVPGSKVEQKFTTVYGFTAETQSHVIILKLLGKTSEDVLIVKAVTVDLKPKCITCGKLNKANSKYCNGCGTSLVLL